MKYFCELFITFIHTFSFKLYLNQHAFYGFSYHRKRVFWTCWIAFNLPCVHLYCSGPSTKLVRDIQRMISDSIGGAFHSKFYCPNMSVDMACKIQRWFIWISAVRNHSYVAVDYQLHKAYYVLPKPMLPLSYYLLLNCRDILGSW